MKGRLSIAMNQATMVDAMQQYFDKQLTAPHTVQNVKRDPSSYSEPEGFIVEFSETEPTQS